ncbi:cytochrome P450 [Auriculariales sp. MPI-PUGE-AT-0066]|nr:cytochrome P450 [Auriculariales sp. MPI-PUGE-AT-0066]
MPIAPFTVLGLLAAGLLVLALAVRRRSRLPLPPGPPGLPILGNALDIPAEYGWVKFAEWSQQYGDVTHLTALGRHIVILGSQEAVNDLLVKRGANYSDRPVLPMAYLSGWQDATGLVMNGKRLQAVRRLLARVLSPRACQQHASMQQQTSLSLVQKLFRRSTNKLANDTHWFASHIILKLGHDPLIELNEAAMRCFCEATNPSWIVNIFPIFRHMPQWFPGGGFHRQARIFRSTVAAMYDVPLNKVKEAMSHSFVATLLRGENGAGVSAEEEDLIRRAAGDMYGGGGETTASALQLFYLAMVLSPEVQRRAQAELDSVIGEDRLPTMEDRPSLPFIEAIVKEVYRWNPALPAAIPHCTTEEDVYRGWRIPAKTMLIPNIWQITHDPKLYPDPLSFKPDRYMSTSVENESISGSGKPAQNPDPRSFVFGFGRRECPGRHLADASVWIAIAVSLATFNIMPRKNASGKPVLPIPRFSGATVSQPEEFPYVLEPRSEQALQWLQADAKTS